MIFNTKPINRTQAYAYAPEELKKTLDAKFKEIFNDLPPPDVYDEVEGPVYTIESLAKKGGRHDIFRLH